MLPYLYLAAAVPAIMGFGEAARRHFAVERHHQLDRGDTNTGTDRPGMTFFELLAMAVLVVFSGLRFDIGTDYDGYAAIYRRVDTADWGRELAVAPQEPGFTLLMLVIKMVDPTPITLFWVTSILSIVPAFLAIRRASARPVLAVLLYVLLAFYLVPFNLVRQGMAISLLFWATTCLVRRRGAFLAVTLLAVSFHVSAIIVLALMWVTFRWRPTRVTAALVLGSGVIAMLLLGRFTALGDLVAGLNPRYESYLTTEGAGLGTYLQIVLFLVLLVYAAVLGRQDPVVEARTDWMAVFVLIGVAFMLVSIQAVALGRMAPYFTIYLVLLLPERVSAARNPLVHDVALVTGGAVFYVFHLLFYGGLVPYQTYLT